MADKEIDDLTAAAALDGTELVHIVQGGNSRKATVQELTGIGASGIITETTDERELSASDAGKYIIFTNSGAIGIGVPASTFSEGDEIFFEQAGGELSVNAGSGFTLNSRNDEIRSAGEGSVLRLKFSSATEATLSGDLLGTDDDGSVVLDSHATGNHTLTISQFSGNDYVWMEDSSANSVTVPADLSPAPTKPVTVVQAGTGVTTIVADTGVTLYAADDVLTLRTQYSVASIIPIASNEYLVIGDLGTPE